MHVNILIFLSLNNFTRILLLHMSVVGFLKKLKNAFRYHLSSLNKNIILHLLQNLNF